MNKQLVFTASLLLACGSTLAYAGSVAPISGSSNVSSDAIILAQNTSDEGATINGETAEERSKRIQQESEEAEKKAGDKAKVTTQGEAKGKAGAESDSGSADAEAGASGGVSNE